MGPCWIESWPLQGDHHDCVDGGDCDDCVDGGVGKDGGEPLVMVIVTVMMVMVTVMMAYEYSHQ